MDRLKKTVASIIFLTEALMVPEWRNWQTRWTQNPVPLQRGVGSIPSSGTNYFYLEISFHRPK
jgi:hypothetical protein